MTEALAPTTEARSAPRSSAGRCRRGSSRRRCSRRRSRCRSSRRTRSRRSPTRPSRRSSCCSRVSAASAHLVFPISIAIALLLAIVVVSYMQTVRVYETSGGAYIVARENLGTLPSLVGAAALLTDYVLTVAVSISAGIFAVTSFAPSLSAHKVGALARLPRSLIVLANLRGVRESGLALRAADLSLRHRGRRARRRGRRSSSRPATRTTPSSRTRCRSAPARSRSSSCCGRSRPGSTALTGVEAIANGVNAFRRPHGKNAAQTLAILGVDRDHALPRRLVPRRPPARARRARPTPSSRRSRAPSSRPGSVGELHVLRRAGTDAARPDPRREHVVPGLPAALGAARTRPLRAAAVHEPRRPARLLERDARARDGRRRCCSWIYGANTNSLIHLYVIGVFTAFTLSQAGMVRYWLRVARHAAGRRRLLVNGVGATATGVVDARRRLHEVRRGRLARDRRDPDARRWRCSACGGTTTGSRAGCAPAPSAVVAAPPARNTTLLARRVARRGDRSGASVRARDLERTASARVHVPARRHRSGHPAALVQAAPACRSRRSIRRSASPRRCSSRCGGCRAASPTSSPSSCRSSSAARRSLEQARHPRELALKFRLLSEPGVVVADVPVVREPAEAEPPRLVARVLVSGVNAASMRAVNYAQTLGVADVRAVHFAFSAGGRAARSARSGGTTGRDPARGRRGARTATSAARCSATCAS